MHSRGCRPIGARVYVLGHSRALLIVFSTILSIGQGKLTRMCNMGKNMMPVVSNLEPQQVHVALGRSDPVTYVISWVTLGELPDKYSSSMVMFTQARADTLDWLQGRGS